MKKPGSYFYLEKERNQDLLSVFNNLYSKTSYIDLEFYHRLANHPSRRFWVSEERAAIVLSKMYKGFQLEHMIPSKRRMYYDLYNTFISFKKRHPGLSFADLVSLAVNSPAPCFYLTTTSTKEIIYRIRRQWYNKEKRYKKKVS